MSMFETYLMVDWSSRKKPSPLKESRDAIWWAALRPEDTQPKVRYERTRSSAIGEIRQFLVSAVNAGQRVLAGFDFAFGYPRGLVETLRSGLVRRGRDDFPQVGPDASPALEMWQWLHKRIEDDRKNDNNRFDVAAAINEAISGRADLGPFWGRHKPKDEESPPRDQVSTGKPDFDFSKFKEKRVTDALASGAKSVFQLYGTGSVGSQVLTGLPRLYRLWKEFEKQAVVWPFDTCFEAPNTAQSSHRIVIVEIYPSLLGDAIERHRKPNEIVDSAQVRLNALAFSLLDKGNELEHLFLGPRAPGTTTSRERPSLSDIQREEGWIFGVDQKSYNKYRLLCALMEYFRSQE